MEFTEYLESLPIAKARSFSSNFNFARVFIASTKRKWNNFCESTSFASLINVPPQHRIFRMQQQICQIHFLVLIKCWVPISLYKYDNLLYGNSVCTLWVWLLANLRLSRNLWLACLVFSLPARFGFNDIWICFWTFHRLILLMLRILTLLQYCG